MRGDDSLGLAGIARGLPDQITTAREAAQQADLSGVRADRIRAVVFAGMGGSGIGGDIASAIAGTSCAVPVVVTKDHRLPSFAGEGSLVIATSFSGNTAETLDAVAEARDRGAALVFVSAGGRLADHARDWRVPHVQLDRSIPMPRAAIGAVGIVPLVVLARLGLISDIGADLENCIAHLRKRVARLSDEGGPADRLARTVGHTFPLIYSAGPIGAVAAYRFKCQVNENAKAPAFFAVLPEANHNEIAGWGQHGDVTRQVLTAVQLRHDFEPARVSASYEYLTEVLDEVVAAVTEVRAEGDSRLAQLFDLVAFADFASLHMARRAELDPGPIPTLDELKRRLG